MKGWPIIAIEKTTRVIVARGEIWCFPQGTPGLGWVRLLKRHPWDMR